jgi:hypothetical protein
MTDNEIKNMLNDVIRYVRDIKFSLIFGKQIELVNDLEQLSGNLPFLFGRNIQKKRNLYVSQMKELGAVLTGSAALYMYKIGGKRIFKRLPNDLDFLITRDNFIKFCGMNNFTNVSYGNKVVSIDFHTGKDRGTDSYGYHKGYWYYTDFDVIGVDEDIKYEQIGDLKVHNLMDIIHYKIYMVENYLSDSSYSREKREQAEKHIKDLFRIITAISTI